MRKLSRPLHLADGGVVATLGAARQFIVDLPARHKKKERWEYAAKLLLKASNGTSPILCELATDQMERALRADGFIQTAAEQ
jgi:hypothetical protein